MTIYCHDLRNDPDFPGCCHSCHDDSEAGYMELIERYDGERLTHIVCCNVFNWLEECQPSQTER